MIKFLETEHYGSYIWLIGSIVFFLKGNVDENKSLLLSMQQMIVFTLFSILLVYKLI